MASKLYGNVIGHAFNKEIDLDSDQIKMALVKSTYAPNQDTDEYFSSVAAHEVSGTGYTAGGVTLAGKTVSYNGATNEFTFDADDVVIPGSTITARFAVIYDDTPATAGQKPLIGYVDFTSDQSSVAGNFTVTWNASGIFKMTVA